MKVLTEKRERHGATALGKALVFIAIYATWLLAGCLEAKVQQEPNTSSVKPAGEQVATVHGMPAEHNEPQTTMIRFTGASQPGAKDKIARLQFDIKWLDGSRDQLEYTTPGDGKPYVIDAGHFRVDVTPQTGQFGTSDKRKKQCKTDGGFDLRLSCACGEFLGDFRIDGQGALQADRFQRDGELVLTRLAAAGQVLYVVHRRAVPNMPPLVGLQYVRKEVPTQSTILASDSWSYSFSWFDGDLKVYSPAALGTLPDALSAQFRQQEERMAKDHAEAIKSARKSAAAAGCAGGG